MYDGIKDDKERFKKLDVKRMSRNDKFSKK